MGEVLGFGGGGDVGGGAEGGAAGEGGLEGKEFAGDRGVLTSLIQWGEGDFGAFGPGGEEVGEIRVGVESQVE